MLLVTLESGDIPSDIMVLGDILGGEDKILFVGKSAPF